MNAEITLSYKSIREAEAVFEAVTPENVEVPKGLAIKTIRHGAKVFTKIACATELLTFIATIDDFMSAVSVSERSFSVVKKNRTSTHC